MNSIKNLVNMVATEADDANFDAWQATEIDRLNAQAQRSHDEEMREFGEWVVESEDEENAE